MSSVTDEQKREWMEAWKRAGPAMEELRHKELEVLTESESVHIFNGLESPFSPELRESSGLVEQQRWFSKLRSRSAE